MAEKTVIALGFFDGVHIGHGALLRKAVERARELDAVPAAFTFDRSPREFVTGESIPLLTTAEERAVLMRELYGIERVIFARFDRRMMQIGWMAFLNSFQGEGGDNAVHFVAGHDYRFGYKNEGTPERLREYCASHGLGCDVIPAVTLDGVTVSSRHIRELVEAGDVARAADFLGHPFALTGKVVHGQHLGTEELFPTVNLDPALPCVEEKSELCARVLPKRGVYAARAVLPDGRVYAAVTNVGVRPTVSDDGTVTIETYLVDFDGDLYGAEIRVEFLRFLRAERRFASTAELHAQIEQDIASLR